MQEKIKTLNLLQMYGRKCKIYTVQFFYKPSGYAL